MPASPALTAESLGAWLLKVNPAAGALAELVGTGFENVATRCVRPSYRTELVATGQPVLLWVSGGDPRYPRGIHAHGRTTGPVVDGPEGPVMPVQLRPLDPIVLREELRAHSELSGLEVLRMPAGSNPSYLDRTQYAALCAAFPQVDHRVRPGVGTA